MASVSTFRSAEDPVKRGTDERKGRQTDRRRLQLENLASTLLSDRKMLTSLRCLLFFGVLIKWPIAIAFAQGQLQERTPAIASSGPVEVSEIRIARVSVSDASPEADLTNMRLSLWIDVKDVKARDFLVRLAELEPIADDTGKILSTDERRREIRPLAEEVRASELKSFRGRRGPVVSLLLDAPSRGASRIKTLKGRIEVTPAGRETITLKDLPSLVGKRVKHDLLTETNVVPRIEIDDDVTEVMLEITGQHDRLIDWAVAQDGRPLRPAMESKSGIGDPVKSLGKGYRRIRPDKNTSLLIAVTTIGMKQVIEFEFADLDLP